MMESHERQEDQQSARGAIPVTSLLQPQSSASTAVPTSGHHYETSTSARYPYDPVRGSLGESRPSSLPRGPGTYGSLHSTATGNASNLERFELEILQEPQAARACGPGEKDRRVIDPPPILQLYLKNFQPDNYNDERSLTDPYNTVHCSLFKVSHRDEPIDEGEDVTVAPHPSKQGHVSRLLMGTLVMSPFHCRDVTSEESKGRNGGNGVYFIFHDVSCRQNGLYKLKFSLASLDPKQLGGKTQRNPVSATIVSEAFEVYSAKDFPGMTESSRLARDLRDQGATIPRRRGAENQRNRDNTGSN